MKKIAAFVSLLLLCALFAAACGNLVMEKWWEDQQAEQPDPEPEPETPASTKLYVDGILQMEADLSSIFAWIKDNVTDTTYYTIRLGEDASLLTEEGRLLYPGKTGVSIYLAGISAERTITIKNSVQGSLFEVGQDVTLVLNENITLKGHSGNNTALVTVDGGTLRMKAGSAIKDNQITLSSGIMGIAGGVIVKDDSSLIMDGGEISGNSITVTGRLYGGGGVCVSDRGTFTMNGGKISDNNVSSSSASDIGGGVFSWGNFTLNNGEISDNTAFCSYSNHYAGGGVFLGGHLSAENKIINGGKITRNSTGGGGTQACGGGGICVRGGLAITGGEISANSTNHANGGGGIAVCMRTEPIGADIVLSITIGSGVIYGSDSDGALKNTANGSGNAVYAQTVRDENVNIPVTTKRVDATMNVNDRIGWSAADSYGWD